MSTTPSTAVYISTFKTWPVGGGSYYYVLTNPTVSYSSGSTIYANGNNYATFTCRWEKYVQGGSGIPVDSSTVIATPTAPTYFTVTGNSLKFNYNSYKTTQVDPGSRNVTLTYQGQTCDASFNFQGNSYSNKSEISAIVPNKLTIDASGGETTYTGGYVYDYKHWTSGYDDYSDTVAYLAQFKYGDVGYGQAYNSQNNNFVGTIVPSGRVIDIPSLGTTQVAAGSYTFYTQTYNGVDASVTVNQVANTRSATHGITIRNYSGGAELTTVDVSAGQQTLQFYVQDAYFYVYTSGAKTSTSTTTISSSNYTVTVYDGSTGSSRNCVSSVTKSGNIVTVYISANSSTTLTRSAIIAVDGNSQYSYISKGFEIAQAVSTATYHYELRNPSVSYSNGGNSLSPKQQGTTGSNYATFTAYYCKVNDNTNQVDTSTLVTAVPSGPTGFTTDGNKLFYYYDGYKGTEILSGTKTATLSYGDATSITASFSFQGNTGTSTKSISTPVPAVSSFPASGTKSYSGGIVTYTGGVFSKHTTWTSGYVEDSSYMVTYGEAYHSQNSNIAADAYYGELYVPSLGKTTVSAGTYTFSATVEGITSSFTISQAANTVHPRTTYMAFIDSDDTPIDYELNVTNDEQYLDVYVGTTTEYTWDSGDSSLGNVVKKANNTYVVKEDENMIISDGCIARNWNNEPDIVAYPYTGNNYFVWRIHIKANALGNFQGSRVIFVESNDLNNEFYDFMILQGAP